MIVGSKNTYERSNMEFIKSTAVTIFGPYYTLVIFQNTQKADELGEFLIFWQFDFTSSTSSNHQYSMIMQTTTAISCVPLKGILG